MCHKPMGVIANNLFVKKICLLYFMYSWSGKIHTKTCLKYFLEQNVSFTFFLETCSMVIWDSHLMNWKAKVRMHKKVRPGLKLNLVYV